jgi:hypothetical protein
MINPKCPNSKAAVAREITKESVTEGENLVVNGVQVTGRSQRVVAHMLQTSLRSDLADRLPENGDRFEGRMSDRFRENPQSRSDSEYRRYQRTAQRMSAGSVCRHLKIVGRIAISRFFHVVSRGAYGSCNTTCGNRSSDFQGRDSLQS